MFGCCICVDWTASKLVKQSAAMNTHIPLSVALMFTDGQIPRRTKRMCTKMSAKRRTFPYLILCK